MLRFFDYIFYRVCKAYSRTKDSSPEATASCIVAIMQSLNILSILMLIAILINDNSFISKTLIVFFTVASMIFYYIRYIYHGENNYKELEKKWMNETKKFKKGIFVVIYIVLSFLLTLGLAIYSGNKKW